MNSESKSPPSAEHSHDDAPHHHHHGCGCSHDHHHDSAASPAGSSAQTAEKDATSKTAVPHPHGHAGDCCGCGHDHDHHHADDHDHDAEAEVERRFFFSLEVVVLLMWAVALVFFVVSGRVIHFLAPTGWFREQALIGGLVLAVLAAFNFLMRRRFPGCGHDHGHEHDENGCCPSESSHDHHHHDETTWLGRAATIFLLAAPVSLAVAYAPNDWSDAYKIQMANSRSASNAPVATKSALSPDKQSSASTAYTLDDFKKQVDLSPDGNFILPITSLWSVAGDSMVRPVITGQQVETIGQVVKDSLTPGRLRAFELMVSCCAADARPVSFPLDFGGQPLPDFREMGWYKMVGTVDFEDERGGKVTLLRVKSMKPWARPNSSGPMY